MADRKLEMKDGKIWFSSFSGDTNQIGLQSFDGLKLEEATGELASFHSFSEGSIVDKKGNIFFVKNQIL